MVLYFPMDLSQLLQQHWPQVLWHEGCKVIGDINHECHHFSTSTRGVSSSHGIKSLSTFLFIDLKDYTSRNRGGSYDGAELYKQFLGSTSRSKGYDCDAFEIGGFYLELVSLISDVKDQRGACMINTPTFKLVRVQDNHSENGNSRLCS